MPTLVWLVDEITRWLVNAIIVLIIATLAAGAWALLSNALKRALHRWPWLHRLAARNRIAAMAMLRSLDILACTIWLAPLYVLGLADKPTGRRMISSYVGMAAVNGHYWAIALEGFIDWGAELFGDRPGHCLRAYLHYKGRD